MPLPLLLALMLAYSTDFLATPVPGSVPRDYATRFRSLSSNGTKSSRSRARVVDLDPVHEPVEAPFVGL